MSDAGDWSKAERLAIAENAEAMRKVWAKREEKSKANDDTIRRLFAALAGMSGGGFATWDATRKRTGQCK